MSAKNKSSHNKKYSKKPPKDQCTHLISVLIAGFPPETAIKDVRDFLLKIAFNQKSTVIRGPKNSFRGFLFVHFKQMKSAQNFADKSYYFGDKQLDCKISINHNDFTIDSLQNIREPKKIIVGKLPQTLQKQDIARNFNKYGEIEEIIIVNATNDEFCNAFITFENYKDSKTCINEKQVYLITGEVVNVSYAIPKFSNYMLKKIDPGVRFYITLLKKEIIPFDPEDFIHLYDEIIQRDNSEKQLEDFYKRFGIDYLEIKNELQKKSSSNENTATDEKDIIGDKHKNPLNQNSHIFNLSENLLDSMENVTANLSFKLKCPDKNKQRKYDESLENSNIQPEHEAKSDAKNVQRENLKKDIQEDREPHNKKYNSKFKNSDYDEDVYAISSKIVHNNKNCEKNTKFQKNRPKVACNDLIKKNMLEPVDYNLKNDAQKSQQHQDKHGKDVKTKILNPHHKKLNPKFSKDPYEADGILQDFNYDYECQNMDYVEKINNERKVNYDDVYVPEKKYVYDDNNFQNYQFNYGENDAVQQNMNDQNFNYDFDSYRDISEKDNRNYNFYNTDPSYLQNDTGKNNLPDQDYYAAQCKYQNQDLNSYNQNEFDNYYNSNTYSQGKYLDPNSHDFTGDCQSYDYYYDQYGYDNTGKYQPEIYREYFTQEQQLSNYEADAFNQPAETTKKCVSQNIVDSYADSTNNYQNYNTYNYPIENQGECVNSNYVWCENAELQKMNQPNEDLLN